MTYDINFQTLPVNFDFDLNTNTGFRFHLQVAHQQLRREIIYTSHRKALCIVRAIIVYCGVFRRVFVVSDLFQKG